MEALAMSVSTVSSYDFSYQESLRRRKRQIRKHIILLAVSKQGTIYLQVKIRSKYFF